MYKLQWSGVFHVRIPVAETNMSYLPLLVLKGIDFTTGHMFVQGAKKQL